MDNAILKKRLNTFKSDGDKLKNVSDEVLGEFLRSYEVWPGKATEFFRNIGLSKMQFVSLMKKAKKLNREGRFAEGEFKEIQVEGANTAGTGFSGQPCAIELAWEAGKIIRFSQVEQLVDFLKKVA